MSNAIEETSQPDRHQRIALKEVFKVLRSHFLVTLIGSAALLLFICSSTRHLWYKSTAFDLGIYDQVVYLLSQGLPPISTYLGFHHMGNHAAYSVYLLALLYKIYPSIYWLFAVQAICLALGALPTWMLARQAGLTPSLSSAMAIAYLLYPVIFNVNIFDFHPEVMALPAILAAIWAARAGKTVWFCVAIVFILGCKDALSLTVAAMGVWLLVFEKRRFYGLFALVAGLGWFLIATKWIIPTFSGAEPAAVKRYAYLGDSVMGIAKNLVLQPGIVLGRIFSLGTLRYLALLVSPLLWGLFPRYLTPLVSTIPVLMFNILSDAPGQRYLHNQYSLPILPFLLVAVIATLAAGQGLLRRRRWIVLWSLVVFLVVGKWSWFTTEYKESIGSWRANGEAIAQIPPHQGGVITDNYLGAHLSERPIVHLVRPRTLAVDLPKADYVLLNLQHNWRRQRDNVQVVFERLKQHPEFQLSYQRDEVYLFTRKPG
jgi:uncharacterized membrane protein